MAIDIREHSRFAHVSGRPLPAIALGCCVLVLALVPAATARSDHGHHGQGTQAQSSGGGEQSATGGLPVELPASLHPHGREHDKGGEGSTGCCAPQPPVVLPTTSDRHSHGNTSQTPANGSAGSGGEHGHEHERGGGSDGHGHHSREGGGSGGEAGGSGRHGHHFGGGQEAGVGAGSNGNSPKARQSRAPSVPSAPAVRTVVSGVQGAVGATTGAPSSATPASAVPAIVAAPSVVSPTPTPSATATPIPQPSGASAKSRVGSKVHKRARRAGARHGTAATTTTFSTTAGGSSAAALATATHQVADKTAKRTSHKPASPERLPPLVKTITKIVGVVPAAVRALIGLLIALALALAVRTRVAAVRARRLDRQRTQLLEDVGLLQAALLPIPPARLGPVVTSVAYHPANGPGAGGDFYDVFALEDGRVGVIVGDISGHGRQALPHTALVRFTLRAYLEAGLSPRAAVQTAGTVLEGALGGAFATVVVATYHPRDRTLTYAGAGHPPPIVLGSEALATRTVSGAPPIGTGMRTGTRQTVVSVPGFSQVCFHTDGVTEARIGAELFGGERLTATLSEVGSQADAKALLDSVAAQTDARPDDMAACLLTVAGAALPPKVLVEQLELDGADAVGDRTERFLLACGVEPEDVSELMRSAQAAVALGGPVLVEAHFGEGPVQVELHRDNVAPLLPRQARAAMGAGRSR